MKILKLITFIVGIVLILMGVGNGIYGYSLPAFSDATIEDGRVYEFRGMLLGIWGLLTLILAEHGLKVKSELNK